MASKKSNTFIETAGRKPVKANYNPGSQPQRQGNKEEFLFIPKEKVGGKNIAISRYLRESIKLPLNFLHCGAIEMQPINFFLNGYCRFIHGFGSDSEWPKLGQATKGLCIQKRNPGLALSFRGAALVVLT